MGLFPSLFAGAFSHRALMGFYTASFLSVSFMAEALEMVALRAMGAVLWTLGGFVQETGVRPVSKVRFPLQAPSLLRSFTSARKVRVS